MAYSCPITCKEIAPLLCDSVEKMISKHIISESRQLPVCTRTVGSKVRLIQILLEALQKRTRTRRMTGMCYVAKGRWAGEIFQAEIMAQRLRGHLVLRILLVI